MSEKGEKVWGLSEGKLHIFSRSENRIVQTVEYEGEEIVNFTLNREGRMLVTFTSD